MLYNIAMQEKTWKMLHVHPERWSRYRMRERVIDAIRAFFKKEKFHEVETPLLLPQPSTEPFLEVFETSLAFSDGRRERAFLPTSPEFFMKKLLAAGSGSIFQICKSFRNGEGRSSKHNPEFTILEWYRTPGDYRDIMDDTEHLMQHILKTVKKNAKGKLRYQGKVYTLSSPWERITVSQAFERYAGITQDDMLSKEKLLEVGSKKGYQVDRDTTWEQMFNQILMNEIEPNLGTKTPTILYDYPASQAALSKKRDDDPRFAERFEVFLAGFELGNAFTELTDAVEQKQRCLEDLAERRRLGKVEYGLDEDFIKALEAGMPPTGGVAVGVDRLIALFADVASIQDTMLFPVDDLFPQRV